MNRFVLVVAPAAGLLAGVAAWWAAGAVNNAPLPTIPSPLRPSDARPPAQAPASASAPLIALVKGKHAVVESAMILQGIVHSGGRTAALIAFDGKPAQWVGTGESIGDNRVVEIGRSTALVDTPAEYRTLNLGQSDAETSKPKPPTAPASQPATNANGG